MVEYSSRLRMNKTVSDSAPFSHRNNAIETLKLVGLFEKMHCIIPGEDSSYDGLRGQLGLDMKLLSLAIELVTYAAIVVLDDFLLGIDITLRGDAMRVLYRLAERGHTVICTIGKEELDMRVFESLDSVILLAEGRVIYAAEVVMVRRFFCSEDLGYTLADEVDLVDFLFDISTGTERPNGNCLNVLFSHSVLGKPEVKSNNFLIFF